MVGEAGSVRRRPVIGLTTYREQAQWTVWDQSADLLPSLYTRSVEAAGGVVALLPPQAEGADELVARLDGVIITGGPDIEPERYGAEPHAKTVRVRRDRDAWEVAVLDAAERLRDPDAGHLPRHAVDGRSRRRGPGPARPRCRRPCRARPGRQRVRLDLGDHRRRIADPHAWSATDPGQLSSPPVGQPASRLRGLGPGRRRHRSRPWRTPTVPSGSACSGIRRAATTTGCSAVWSRRPARSVSRPDRRRFAGRRPRPPAPRGRRNGRRGRTPTNGRCRRCRVRPAGGWS